MYVSDDLAMFNKSEIRECFNMVKLICGLLVIILDQAKNMCVYVLSTYPKFWPRP